MTTSVTPAEAELWWHFHINQ